VVGLVVGTSWKVVEGVNVGVFIGFNVGVEVGTEVGNSEGIIVAVRLR